MILFSVIANRIEGKIAMIFDQSLHAYLHEVDDVLVAWEEKPSGNFEMEAQLLASNYHKNRYRILAFILPHLQEYYGCFTDEEATEKLGKPHHPSQKDKPLLSAIKLLMIFISFLLTIRGRHLRVWRILPLMVKVSFQF
ncbi:MAG: hypothetical protein ACLVJN_07200 [Streptococcus parasanguinis]